MKITARTNSAVLNFSFRPSRSSIATAASCGVGFFGTGMSNSSLPISVAKDELLRSRFEFATGGLFLFRAGAPPLLACRPVFGFRRILCCALPCLGLGVQFGALGA